MFQCDICKKEFEPIPNGMIDLVVVSEECDFELSDEQKLKIKSHGWAVAQVCVCVDCQIEIHKAQGTEYGKTIEDYGINLKDLQEKIEDSKFRLQMGMEEREE